MTESTSPSELRKTPLHDLHVELGAKLVEFAGYAMPVQYPAGVMAEHRQTRESAGLFDVSHMGQVRLLGDKAAAAFEALVPGDIQALAPGEMRYTMFTNPEGGVIDDLMALAREDHLFLVVNAACKERDLAHMAVHLPGIEIDHQADRGLLALQGPKAAAVLAGHAPAVAGMSFMTAMEIDLAGASCLVTRSGYTGEDGFEIGMPGDAAEAVARLLLADPAVEPIGLGARDSLRLEAGLCLYGHDLDEETSPIEAALAWTISKRRREEGGFLGDARILRELAEKPARRRVGIRPEGRVVAREGVEIQIDGAAVGQITSGGFGPSVEHPVAMGYVATAHAKVGAKVDLVVRGQARPAEIVRMPFHPHRYFRG
ncbi:MAG: glycine cleavage system aminomethyltransferase GcvT [Alphaproteobacteria bacterium]